MFGFSEMTLALGCQGMGRMVDLLSCVRVELEGERRWRGGSGELTTQSTELEVFLHSSSPLTQLSCMIYSSDWG